MVWTAIWLTFKAESQWNDAILEDEDLASGSITFEAESWWSDAIFEDDDLACGSVIVRAHNLGL